jgi:hypothetical protein
MGRFAEKKEQGCYLNARRLLNRYSSCQEFLHQRIDLFFNPINVSHVGEF